MIETILAVVPHLSGNQGSSINERGLLKAIARKGFRVIVFSFDGWLPKIRSWRERKGVIVWISLPNLYPVWAITWALFSTALPLVVTVLDTLVNLKLIYIRDPLIAFTLTLIPKKIKKKTIVKIPTIIEEEASNPLFTFLYIAADKVLASDTDIALAFPTKEFGIKWARKRGWLGNRKVILPAGAEPELKSLRRRRKYVRIEKPLRLGFIGGVNKARGAHLIPDILIALKSKGIDAEFWVVGQGPLLNNLIRKCKASNLPCVFFGSRTHEEALKILSQLDVLILPMKDVSRISKTVIEAWCIGVPVITTSPTLAKGDVAVLARNVKEIVDAILNFRSLISYVEKGFRICEKYSYEKLAERVLISVR